MASIIYNCIITIYMQICTNKFIHNQQDVATVVNDFSYLFSTIGTLQNSLIM